MPWLTREEGATKGSRGEERAAKGSKEEKGYTLKTTAVGVVVGWKSTAGEQQLFRFYVVLLKSAKKSKR